MCRSHAGPEIKRNRNAIFLVMRKTIFALRETSAQGIYVLREGPSLLPAEPAPHGPLVGAFPQGHTHKIFFTSFSVGGGPHCIVCALINDNESAARHAMNELH